MDKRSAKMVTLNVSGQLFTLPEADILQYPYSKLADVASFTLPDDIASLNVPADAFAILVYYLSTRKLPPTPHPTTLLSTFKTLGIPFPSNTVDQHTASIGASGTLREWEANVFTSPPSSADPERLAALRDIERGLLTGRSDLPDQSAPSSSRAQGGDLPAYEEVPQRHSSTLGQGESLVHAISSRLQPSGMSMVVLVPSDVRTLAPVERPSWDTGTGAAEEEEVLSFVGTPALDKKVLRLPREYTLKYIREHGVEGEIQMLLEDHLRNENSMKKKDGRECGMMDPTVQVWTEDEVVLKHVNPMGLLETRNGTALVVQVWQ